MELPIEDTVIAGNDRLKLCIQSFIRQMDEKSPGPVWQTSETRILLSACYHRLPDAGAKLEEVDAGAKSSS